MGRDSKDGGSWRQALVFGLQGTLCLCGSGNLPGFPLWEVNEKILAVTAGRERGLKCPFPRAFCPTAALSQNRYFCVAVITSIF